jgi:hypothetical protein
VQSLEVNKSNFEKAVSADADLPEDVRRQIESAVKIYRARRSTLRAGF